MTQREFDIYKIIRDEPLISQNEIASRLGITRSAVSSYLVTMQKKGIIKGRGYIINTNEYPLLVGPGHIDIVSTCSRSSSRPGLYDSKKTSFSYGGAIKNIAHYLTRLELLPHAIFTVSSDFFGMEFLKDCSRNRIDAADSLILNDTAMPIYNEILSEDGEIIAAASMTDNLAGRLTPDYLKTKEHVFRGATQITLHDTLSHEAVDYISSAFRDSTLVFFSTYYHDTVKLLDLINRFHYVILSYDTARQLAFPGSEDKLPPSSKNLTDICQKLRESGFQNAVILCSSQQSCLMQENTLYFQNTLSGAPHNRQAYSYYRDASVASILHSLHQGHTPEECLIQLAASKYIAAASSSFFESNYCMELIEKTSKEIESDLSSSAL